MRTNLVQTCNTSANRINLNRTAMRVALIGLFISLGIGNAWAGHDQHTATLNVAIGTGNGTVYASTSRTATTGSAFATFNCGKSSDGQHTGDLYAFATPAAGYTFLGWTTSKTSTEGADKANPKSVAFNVTDASNTQTLYAHFVEKAKVNITFEAPSNGTYTIKVNGGSAETVSSSDVVKNNVTDVTLTATPASGYAFAGWYKLNSAGEFVEDLSVSSPYDASFTKSETIKMGARFVPTTLGKFILKGNSTEYYGLKAATIAAGGSGIIVPVADETLVDGSDLMPFDNGTYTIKAGATLLVPHTSAYTVQVEPEVVTSAATLSAFRTLVLKDGASIVCNGNICVGGKIMSAGGGNKSAYVTGPCGVINMANGGHIELNSGAKLYCWGFIKGQDMDQGNNTVGVGTITANNGAIIKEDFAVGDWRGGTATYAIYNKKGSWKLFPFQSYSIQNIEVPTTYEYGSTLNTFVVVSGGGGNNPADFDIAGSSNTLFLLKDAQSTVRKWYDPTTDLTCYELSGTAQLDALNLVVYISVSSSEYYLPISNSMHIILKNCNMTLSKPLTMQAGSVIEIKNDATVNLEARMHMFDKDEWGKYIHNFYFRSFNNLTSHKDRGAEDSNEGLEDAKLIVDGTFNVVSGKGYLYSTNGGANIMGNGGGKIAFRGALPTATTLYHVTVGSKEQDYIVEAANAIAAANLHNEDDSYTKSVASTTFHNVNGRWYAASAKDEQADHTYNFTYMASGNSGDDVNTPALYGEDKTGLTAGMKWCNVTQDGTCPAIYNATQDLNGTPAANIRYTYQSSDWLQLLKTETEGVYGGSDNSLYAVDGCAVNSLGSVDENCLYTIDGVKKALVDGHFVALEKNTEDEAFHNTANTEEYYISFAGCTWHPATKYAGEEKAYIVEGGIYIWYNNDWLLVEREDPFFFDYNDQNVKRYYEYENGEWVLADPKVRVTDAIEARDFFFLPEAFAIANGKKNATITILKNITDTTTPLSYTQTNTTCTLDLNGHTVNLTITGSGTTGVNMIKIDASGSTFTITDNSAEKDGKLILKQGITTATATKRWYGIVLANGSLALNAGEVQAINDFTYTSTKNTGMISAIYIAAGKTFTMNGGSIYAESPYYPRAIEIAGSASANATVTLNTGTITANATTVTNAMGIYTVGGTTTIKEGVTINATTKTTSAYGIYVDASTSGYWGTVNMTGGTVNATATTTTALGAFVNGTYTFNNTTPNTIKGTYRAVLSISGGSFNVETLGTTTAYGIQTRGTTTITGGTFNVTPKTTTAYGLLVQDGTTTISGTPTFTIKGTTTAYGIYANGATPEDKTGRPYNPNVIVNGGTFDVTTTTGDVAYGVYAGAGTRVITSTASDYYPGIYSSIGTVTVNGGTFNVTAKTYNAIGVYVYRVAAYESGTNTAHVFRGVANIAGGTFTVRDLTHKTTTGACDGVRSYGTLTITGGTFDVAASAATAKNATYVYGVNVYDGTATVSGTPEFTVSAYGTAFGAVANGATPDKATGLPCEADLTIDGGTFNVNTTTSTTAYGVYAAGPAPRVITSTAAGYYPGTYYSKPVATVNGGTFNVKAKTTTAIGAYCGRGVRYDPDVLEPHTIELESFGELNIKGGTFNVSTLGTTTADGVRSFGTTNITGGTFNVTPKTTTATAIRTYAGKTTITGNPHFTVKGTTTVYGLNAGCEAPNTKSGLTYNGEIECNGGTFDLETTTGATCYGVYAYAGSVKITTLHSANADYFAGNYASAGTIVVNDGIFNVKAKTTGAYGVVVPAAVSQSGATGYPTATATAKCDINGGKFLVNGTEKYAVYKKAAKADFKISGGYWGGDGVNDNLAYYAVSPNKVLTLREAHALYPDGYRYTIGEGGTVIWKNGETTLLSEDYLKGETPAYSGATPTKAEDAEYTYTHNGWDPTVEAMANADQTYTATFNHIEKKYTVNVAAGANGSASPASVSGIGCVTASGNITATPNTGYRFANWTLPTGVTAADGYTSESNPIHIHATASGKTITANFAAKTYTVTLDNQSAMTAGAASVTATYNEAMPSIAANLPARTGYAFGGYFTETNGGGTQYYNADGTSAHIWDIDAASPTLYAKWTASIADRELDIVDWTSNSITINVTNLKAESGTNKNNWKIYVNDKDYTRTSPECSTQSRTLTISDLTLTPNDNLLIQLKNDADVIESQHYYKIPQIYTANATLSGTPSSSVVYVYGSKLTISDDITLAALYVCPGAEVEVTDGNTLTVGKLVLRTKPWATAAISGNVSATNVYYTRIAPDGSSEYPTGKYYQFGLPYECAISDVRLSDGTTPAYNTTWILKSYNEQRRAESGTESNNWDVLSSGTIAAGRGYEMFSTYKYYREYYFPVTPTDNTSVSVTRNGDDQNNSGWNIVCSPLMNVYKNESNPVDGLKVSWLLPDGSYDQAWPETIWPAMPFSYQASANGSLDFSSGDFNQTVSAPRRAAYKENIQTEWIHLDVKDGNGVGDHTSVFVHPDRFEATYQTGIDVAKQSLTAARALIYSSHAYGEMAFAGVADVLLENGVALTVYSPKEQELTISMRKNDWLNRMAFVWLIDQATGAQIDLLDSDYSFEVEAGTTAGRFILMGAFFAPQITTDNGNVQSDDEHIKVTKFIYNDKMYIQINGVIYDATGRLVK